ncbi:methanethiol S-methyltransferase [Bradyrhizobium sp. CCGUVB23]|uniref:methanethiol S-methyltransferase n=1 Tax=Bradyrhizobium sp. CCGUVB23 TaxID=2949630 RepID=UPI0020B44F0A|nr:methanethiol S-methyltransferase [Bradyrhizobium sp. CCGUVB23]MCP3460750.1 isoprenylcysteine carboxylmethyltransferase family protein [Bradyrhizobium sp. CCGUVB23]
MLKVNSIGQAASQIRSLRLIALLYGLLAYAAFLVTIVYTAGFVSGIGVPKTIDTGPHTSVVDALSINTLLMALFAIQHTGMARKWFKNRWTRYVPNYIERSTYVLIASLCLMLLFWQWRPLPAVIWHVEDPDVSVMIGTLSFIGWTLVFASTFLIDHFELFGLRHVIANLRGRGIAAQQFRTPLYYKFVRHPIYLGFIIAFWAAPVMTIGHLLFAAVTTTYIFVGIFFEEQDLLQLFGEQYGQYKKQVSMLIPWRKLDR